MHRRTFLKQTAVFLTLANAQGLSAGTKQSTIRQAEAGSFDSHIKDRMVKKRRFDVAYPEDIYIEKKLIPLFNTSLKRLQKVQRLVGHGNFCLLNFDEAIKVSAAYASIGAFSKKELDFLEMIFYSQVKAYGFMGDKPIKTITGKINRGAVKKIPRTGNYLYRGKPIERYEQIIKEVGHDAILTSGVRSVMKQFLLFLNKTKKSRGNLSMASRSLAPPGYSFHGTGDFDIGKKGFGIHNFSERFTRTTVYKKLSDLGYIKFRYKRNNALGVRFEPWHIEVENV